MVIGGVGAGDAAASPSMVA